MPTAKIRASTILSELEQAQGELVGKAVVLTDGKAGTVEGIWLDEMHGLRISIAGHHGKWPVSTVKFAQPSWFTMLGLKQRISFGLEALDRHIQEGDRQLIVRRRKDALKVNDLPIDKLAPVHNRARSAIEEIRMRWFAMTRYNRATSLRSRAPHKTNPLRGSGAIESQGTISGL
jgi:hypothetical protein